MSAILGQSVALRGALPYLLALPAMSAIFKLMQVTLGAILQVVIMCVAGYVLASRGILNKKTQAKMNKLNVSLLTPALLFSKVAFSLNPERLTELAIVPFGFVAVTLVSAFAAFVMSRAITPNSNTLPIALIQSLVITVPRLHWIRNGIDNDSPNDMLGRALTYLVLFSTLGTVQRWSVGATLLGNVTVDQPPRPYSHHASGRDDVTDFLIDARHRLALADRASMASDSAFEHENRSAATPLVQEPRVSLWHKVWANGVVKPYHTVIEFMTVPLWTALLSFIVALIPPLQHFIVQMKPVVSAIEELGSCSIPLTVLVLGAYFVGEREQAVQLEEEGEQRVSHIPDYSWRTILAAVLARMILTPLIMLPILTYVCIVMREGVVDDPIFIACACLVIGSPPALTLAQISSQRGDPNSNVEYLISGTIFISYIVFTTPTAVGLVLTALVIDEIQDQFIVAKMFPALFSSLS
ncbi:hypothetical protein MVES_002919 [Malassezia vespertilionis]|uniref:Uncharacterized protein n=1 Tax=Malassezia vespertilionis TaxID=2020962 RepID=A0A2N1J9B5_9BASI|nr:hypothetical protein MVES_002919 [Malassezia vespertilionis]